MAAQQLQGQKPTTRVARKPKATKAAEVTTPTAMMTTLDQLVPEKERYIHRSIGGQPDFEIFDYALAAALNVLIEGPTGPGKTTAIRAWSAQRARPFYAVSSNVAVDPAQLFGKWVPDGHGDFIWMDGFVTLLVRFGGTLLINEVNFLPERVSTAVFSLLDNRREMALMDHHGEVIKVHRPECWCDLPKAECKKRWLLIVADMNPDYEGTRPLNKAFRNRFNIQLQWDYDRDVEEQLISSAPLLDFMWRLRQEAATEVYSTPVSTNMGMEFERIAKGLGYDFAVANFVNHFTVDERESITKLFEADRDNIEPTIDVQTLSDDELYEKRLGMSHGDVDKEWGVYGIDWAWNDDDDELVDVETTA